MSSIVKIAKIAPSASIVYQILDFFVVENIVLIRKQEALSVALKRVFPPKQSWDAVENRKQQTAACSGLRGGAGATGNTQRLFFGCFLHENGHKLRWQSGVVLVCCTQRLQLHTRPLTLGGGLAGTVEPQGLSICCLHSWRTFQISIRT